MMSIFGNSRIVSAGAVNRFGPIVNPGTRIPIREKRAGSVRILMPKKLISTVACTSHAPVTRASFHCAGFELVNGELLATASAETVGEAASFPWQRLPYNQSHIT